MILDLTQPVEPLHPLVQGRVGWWYGVSGSGGRLLNIMPGDRFHGVPIDGVPNWGSPPGVVGQFANLQHPNLNEVPFTRANGWECPVLIGSNQPFTIAISAATLATVQVALMGQGRDQPGSAWSVVMQYPTGVSAPPQFGIVTTSGGTAGFTATGTTVVPSGQPARLVGTWTPGVGISYYRNGRLEASTSTATTGLRSTGNTGFRIGGGQGLATHGYYWDAAVWGRVLTAQEVAAEYEQSLRGYRTPDSPLRWIRGTAFGLPLGGGGGGSVRIPRFILQTRRRLTGVS